MYVGTFAPTNVRAVVSTYRSIKITWDQSSLSDVTSYFISYAINAVYANNEIVIVSGADTTDSTLSNLEENTPYTITVQAICDFKRSANGEKVSVATYTDGK